MAAADKINATPTSSEKRGRGRPPKKLKVELTDFSPAQTYSSPGTERRRGRPPKFPTSVDSPLAIKTASKSEPRASIDSITGRGRGRPPKAKGKVGRPRKSVGDNSLVNFEEAAAKDADEDEGVQVDDYDNEEEEDLEMDTSNVIIAPAPQRRGRGRPPKKAASEAVTVDVEDEGQDDPEAEGEDYEAEFGDDIEGGKKLTVVKQVETVKEVVTMTESAAPRRGPGRPRKNAILPPIVSGNASLQEGNQSVTAAEALTTASTGKRGRGRPSKKTTTGDTGPTLPVPIPGMVPYGSLNEDGTLAEGPYSPGTPFSPPSDADSSFEMFRGPRAPSPNVIPAAATRPAYYANDSAYEADESSNNYDYANNSAVVPVNSDNDFRRGTTSPIPPAEEANTDNTVPIAKEPLAVLEHIRGEKQLQSSSQPEQPPYTPTKPPTSRKASAAAVSDAGAGGSHPISAGGSMNVQQSPDNDGRSNFQSPRPGSKEQPGIITTFFSKLT